MSPAVRCSDFFTSERNMACVKDFVLSAYFF